MKTGKFLITGRQGSGKTTVGKELRKQGYRVFDIDHTDGLGKLRDLKTGELYDFVDIISRNSDKSVNWDKYWFEVQENKLEEVLNSGDLVFITGGASNLVDFYNKFNKVFVLTADPVTIRDRLLNHEHASHHLPSEIDRILEDFDDKQHKLLESGNNVVEIDSRESLKKIVNTIKRKL